MRSSRTALFVLVLLICADATLARVGGGQSYSGGSSSGRSSGGGSSSGSSSGSGYSGSNNGGGSGSGGGGCAAFTFGLVLMVFFFFFFYRAARTILASQPGAALFQALTNNPALGPPGARLDMLRSYDPNFSRIVFDDFCYSLFAHVHHARGTGDVGRYAPYLSGSARDVLMSGNADRLAAVEGIVVGALEAGSLQGLETPVVRVDVTYDANMTEVVDGAAPGRSSWYVRERWQFERRRDTLSLPPAKAKAEHCPRCGAALQPRTDGACEFCGVKIEDGSFQWYVRSIVTLSRESRGPLLTSNVEEQGTDLPTIRDPRLHQRKKEFEANHPGFRWEDAITRAREIATKLQDAWTSRDWERVRSLETEPLFQTHRYWIDAYIKQRLKNVVDDFKIQTSEPVKVDDDPFYDAITVRQWASGRDYTVDENGNLVAGLRDSVRRWSEYWTLIRSRATQADPSKTVACPNCGAAVVIGPSAICSHCGGKLTSGSFDWVLSRIEQDEAYAG